MRIKELDPLKVANILMYTTLLSNHFGHKWLKTTYKSHFDPDPNDLEGQFVKDLMTLDTPTIIETWYGGDKEATDLLFKMGEGSSAN